MQSHLFTRFNSLVLCFIIFITCLMSTGCWMTPIAVDSTAGAGKYVRSALSPVPNWSLPIKIAGVDNSSNLAANAEGDIYCAAFFSSSSIGFGAKSPHSPISYSYYKATNGVYYMYYTDLFIDKNNKYHYCGISNDTANGNTNLFYVTNALGYVTTTFIGDYKKQYQTSIMTDSKGTTHIFYNDEEQNIFREARLTVTTTSIFLNYYTYQANTPYGTAGIGPDDRIHVLGFNTTTRKIEYFLSSNPSAIHNLSSIPSSFSPGYSPGLAIKVDHHGVIHAAYCSFDSVLRYAVNSSGGLTSWSYSTIDMAGDPGKSGVSITFDSKGKVSVVYTRDDRQYLYLASLNGATWDKQLVSKTNSVYTWPKVVTNKLDEIYVSAWDNSYYYTYFIAKSEKMTHISYSDSSSNLKYATEVDGMSSYEIVTTVSGRGNNAIAVDYFGIPHIAYDSPDNTIKIATRTNGTWSFETAFSSQLYNNANNTNLELKYDLFNHPHLLYIDNSKLTIYGVKTSSNWSYNVFNLGNYVNPYISLAVTTSNLPRFVYTSVSGSTTYPAYVYWNGSGWSYERIYNSDNVSGHRISMVLDGLDNPHVGYVANNFKNYNYAYRKNGVWTNWTISTGISATDIYCNDIALDEDQNPHVAYYWTDNNTIYYQRMIKKTGQSWMINNATNVNAGGNYLSLGLENGYQVALAYQLSTANSLYFRNAFPEFYNLPDIKLLRNGYTISSAFNLKEYFRIPANSWDATAYSDGDINPTSVSGTGTVSYSSKTGNGFASDTHLFVAYPDGTEHHFNNQFKYLDFILSKFPRIISENSTIIHNAAIPLNNYLSRSSTYTNNTIWAVTWMGYPLNISFDNSTLLFSLNSTLSHNMDVKTYVGSNGYDMEYIRVHPILNTHSGFPTASETTNWAYQLPEGISTKPGILWDSSGSSTTIGGTPGSMVVNFTAANQGIKLTPKATNWVKTEPYEWYTVRVLAKAAVLLAQTPKDQQVESPDAVSVNVQFLPYALNGLPPAPTDIAAHFTSRLSSSWRWFEVPLYSSGTSMYPILVVKNGNTTTAQILINKVEIIKAKPGTELMYSKKWVNGMLSPFSSATETTAWAFESVADPAIRPNYTIDSGKLIVNFPDWNYRGIKFTSMVSPGTVRTGKTHTGKMSGVSFKYAYSGYLYYPVITFYLFNSSGVNNATFSEFVACGSLYKTTTNEKGEYRTAYLPTTADGYVQVVLKNGGPGNFYIDDLALESDWDTSDYWDSTLW